MKIVEASCLGSEYFLTNIFEGYGDYVGIGVGGRGSSLT